MLRKYVHDPTHVISHYPLDVSEDLSYDETPIEIIEYRDQVLRKMAILCMSVMEKSHVGRINMGMRR